LIFQDFIGCNLLSRGTHIEVIRILFALPCAQQSSTCPMMCPLG
jgi:hypothetical protein